MNIVAIMPVRNEAWVLGLSARALLMWVDKLVILDHASTDDTPNIIDDLRAEYILGRVRKYRVDATAWDEMHHRQFLLTMAREIEATHVVTVDADEVLTANLLPMIRDQIERRLPPRYVMQLPWLCMRGGIDRVQTTGVWAQQDASMAFVDDPIWHWAANNGYHHHHRHPAGYNLLTYRPWRQRNCGLMHLQFVSERRLRAKQALYLCNEVLRWPGRTSIQELNRQYGYAVYGSNDPNRPDTATAQAPADWWAGYEHLMKYLDVEADPWQLGEVHRLVTEHGREKFAGLDLFGVV